MDATPPPDKTIPPSGGPSPHLHPSPPTTTSALANSSTHSTTVLTSNNNHAAADNNNLFNSNDVINPKQTYKDLAASRRSDRRTDRSSTGSTIVTPKDFTCIAVPPTAPPPPPPTAAAAAGTTAVPAEGTHIPASTNSNSNSDEVFFHSVESLLASCKKQRRKPIRTQTSYWQTDADNYMQQEQQLGHSRQQEADEQCLPEQISSSAEKRIDDDVDTIEAVKCHSKPAENPVPIHSFSEVLANGKSSCSGGDSSCSSVDGNPAESSKQSEEFPFMDEVEDNVGEDEEEEQEVPLLDPKTMCNKFNGSYDEERADELDFLARQPLLNGDKSANEIELPEIACSRPARGGNTRYYGTAPHDPDLVSHVAMSRAEEPRAVSVDTAVSFGQLQHGGLRDECPSTAAVVKQTQPMPTSCQQKPEQKPSQPVPPAHHKDETNFGTMFIETPHNSIMSLDTGSNNYPNSTRSGSGIGDVNCRLISYLFDMPTAASTVAAAAAGSASAVAVLARGGGRTLDENGNPVQQQEGVAASQQLPPTIIPYDTRGSGGGKCKRLRTKKPKQDKGYLSESVDGYRGKMDIDDLIEWLGNESAGQQQCHTTSKKKPANNVVPQSSEAGKNVPRSRKLSNNAVPVQDIGDVDVKSNSKLSKRCRKNRKKVCTATTVAACVENVQTATGGGGGSACGGHGQADEDTRSTDGSFLSASGSNDSSVMSVVSGRGGGGGPPPLLPIDTKEIPAVHVHSVPSTVDKVNLLENLNSTNNSNVNNGGDNVVPVFLDEKTTMPLEQVCDDLESKDDSTSVSEVSAFRQDFYSTSEFDMQMSQQEEEFKVVAVKCKSKKSATVSPVSSNTSVLNTSSAASSKTTVSCDVVCMRNATSRPTGGKDLSSHKTSRPPYKGRGVHAASAEYPTYSSRQQRDNNQTVFSKSHNFQRSLQPDEDFPPVMARGLLIDNASADNSDVESVKSLPTSACRHSAGCGSRPPPPPPQMDFEVKGPSGPSYAAMAAKGGKMDIPTATAAPMAAVTAAMTAAVQCQTDSTKEEDGEEFVVISPGIHCADTLEAGSNTLPPSPALPGGPDSTTGSVADQAADHDGSDSGISSVDMPGSALAALQVQNSDLHELSFLNSSNILPQDEVEPAMTSVVAPLKAAGESKQRKKHSQLVNNSSSSSRRNQQQPQPLKYATVVSHVGPGVEFVGGSAMSQSAHQTLDVSFFFDHDVIKTPSSVNILEEGSKPVEEEVEKCHCTTVMICSQCVSDDQDSTDDTTVITTMSPQPPLLPQPLLQATLNQAVAAACTASATAACTMTTCTAAVQLGSENGTCTATTPATAGAYDNRKNFVSILNRLPSFSAHNSKMSAASSTDVTTAAVYSVNQQQWAKYMQNEFAKMQAIATYLPNSSHSSSIQQ